MLQLKRGVPDTQTAQRGLGLPEDAALPRPHADFIDHQVARGQRSHTVGGPDVQVMHVGHARNGAQGLLDLPGVHAPRNALQQHLHRLPQQGQRPWQDEGDDRQ